MYQRRATVAFALQTAFVSKIFPRLQPGVQFSSSASSFAEIAPQSALLIASRQDPAGLNLAMALLERGGSHWSPLEDASAALGSGEVATWVGPPESSTTPAPACSLWILDEKLTHADDLDVKWQSSAVRKVSDILFLSRHASASGKPCLTVHPIGNPRVQLGVSVGSAVQEYGGRAGRLPPPSPRMARLLRAVKSEVRNAGLFHASAVVEGEEEGEAGARVFFGVCPEATHHGPWVEHTPCCFVEIGSTEDEWTRQDAAAVWAEVLHTELFGGAANSLNGEGCGGQPPLLTDTTTRQTPAAAATPPAALVVVIGIGGGHYAPKVWDVVASSDRIALGHIVPSYALDFSSGGDGDDNEERSTSSGSSGGGGCVSGSDGGGGGLVGWRWSVAEAVRSTRAAYDNPLLRHAGNGLDSIDGGGSGSEDDGDGDGDGDGGGRHGKHLSPSSTLCGLEQHASPEVVALVDKKAFQKASHRHQVVEFLKTLDVRVALSKADILKPHLPA